MTGGNMEKHILTDVDGVLLCWEEGFNEFINSKGHPRIPGTETEYSMAARHGISTIQSLDYIREYNESDAMLSLKPFADSVKYVAKLADMGFRFTAITSMSDHPGAKIHRTNNLKALFGDVFDEVVCLEMGASKIHALMRWADSGLYWIEDHMRQAEAGHEAGLRTVLINHPYNNHYKTDLFPVVSYETPWAEIYKMVCKEYGI
jgi:FMN phosphatase YigB (HAD superfamily)